MKTISASSAPRVKSTRPTLAALSALSALLLISACTTMPSGPRVMALPGSGKTFEQFRFDDDTCRQYAQYQIGGGTAEQAANNALLGSAVVGTVVGAAAGAVMGGHQGAGIGAGAGLLLGSAAGSGAAQRSTYGTERQYDNAYIQCMYGKGHQVPVPGARISRPQAPSASAPPPPPPGYPPPPPRSTMPPTSMPPPPPYSAR